MLQLFQVGADCIYVIHIMYEQLDASLKDSVVRLDVQFVDVHVQLLRNDLRHFVQNADSVYTFYIYVDGEIQGLAYFPLHGKQAVSEAGFQLRGDGALPFVDNDAVVVINVSQHIVPWYWLAAVCYDIMLLKFVGSQFYNLFLVDVQRLCSLFCLLRLFGFAASEGKGYIFLPACCGRFLFQFVPLKISQYNAFLSDLVSQFVGRFQIMQCAELLDILLIVFQSFFLKKSLSMSSPCIWNSFLSRFSMDEIFAFAFAVVAKLIHDGCTFCDLDVRIST